MIRLIKEEFIDLNAGAEEVVMGVWLLIISMLVGIVLMRVLNIYFIGMKALEEHTKERVVWIKRRIMTKSNCVKVFLPAHILIYRANYGYIIDSLRREDWAYDATLPFVTSGGEAGDDTDEMIDLLYRIAELFNPNCKLEIKRREND